MPKLIVERKPRSPISEAYRTIRTNIEFSSIDSTVKKILITSSGPEEGKSTTSSNLALAFAQSGKKTLLIDADLRKPTIYKQFKISNRIGLSNIIVDGVNIFDMAKAQVDGLGIYEIIHHYNEKLDILTSGTIPPNPSEILGSKKMSTFLEAISSKYDKVIIDTPPVNLVTDAQLISTMVDGVVLVVASEITHKESAKRAILLLERVNAKILGAILTRMKVKKNANGYNGYYNYYVNENKKVRRKSND